MVIIIVIYLVSMLLSFFTIPIFSDKVGITAELFVLFTPVINTIWFLYCLYKFIKFIKNDTSNFISDLKKLFDIN
jgi:hypothetical protein